MKLMQRLRTIFRRRVLVLPEPPRPEPASYRWTPSTASVIRAHRQHVLDPKSVQRAHDTARPRAPLPRRSVPASVPAPQMQVSSGDPITDLLLLNAALGGQDTPPSAAPTDDAITAGGGSFGGGGASASWASDTAYDSSPSTSATSDSYSSSDSGGSYDSSSSSSSDF